MSQTILTDFEDRRRAPLRIVSSGVVSPIGTSVTECFENLVSGQSALTPIADEYASLFHADSFYELPGGIGSGEYGRAGRLLCEAIEQAIDGADAGMITGDTPVIIGTGLGETRTAELAWIDRVQVGEDELTLGGAIRTRFGFSDVNVISNACAASLYALAMAMDLIEAGETEHVVVAGVDIISTSMFGLLDRVHPVPPTSLRPFDADRGGVLMGEGAVAVVVSASRGRGPIVHSVALGCDAFHVTAPDPLRMAECMRAAQDAAGLSPDDVGLVLAHGTGTVLNDRAEGAALTSIWSDGRSPAVTAIKGATGHTSGGSGLFSLMIAAECLRRGVATPILGLETPDPDAASLDLVATPRVLRGPRTAQVNAFGFGGLDAVALISLERAR